MEPSSLYSPPVVIRPARKFPIFFLLALIFTAVISSGGTYYYLKGSLPFLSTVPPVVVVPTPTVSVFPTPEPIAAWVTFSDVEMGFSFRHPSRYTRNAPVPGGDAAPPGNYVFTAGTKSDSFHLDVVPFKGILSQFITQYTSTDSVSKNLVVKLNSVTPLGDKLALPDVRGATPVAWYKYVNYYPNSPTVTTYTGFFIQGNLGFVIRCFTQIENLDDFRQIASTFAAIAPQVSPTSAPVSWKTFSSPTVGVSFQYPSDWVIEKEFVIDGVSTLKLTAVGKPNLEIYIGSPFVYSTSSVVCANQWCEEQPSFNFTSPSGTFTTQVIKASIGPEKVFERFSFQTQLGVNNMFVSGKYMTAADLVVVKQILTSIKLIN